MDHRGKCPSTLDDLILAPVARQAKTRWKGPYLQDVTQIPADPWGNPYLYAIPGPGGEPYEIRSLGEDGREGGTDYAEDLSSIKR